MGAGYRVIVPDLIGFGRSDKYVDHRKYSVELHKSSTLQLLDHLQLVNRASGVNLTLVGHNWGALFGLGIAKAGFIFLRWDNSAPVSAYIKYALH